MRPEKIEEGKTLSNEILWFLFMITDLSMVLIVYRFFGKSGLYAVVVMSSIVCNIQVIKLVNLFGMTATLGNIVYASNFFATDILSEYYGKRDAKKAVWLGFSMLIVATIWMQIALLFRPSPDDFSQEHLRSVFSMMPRIAFASLTAYILAQLHDVWAFHFWKEKTKGKHLWLRNNASTMVSQLIDSVAFTTLAFLGTVDAKTFWSILLTTYLFKFIVAAFDTPFMYLTRVVKPHED
jgi:uncharacterized integral membrane protein (TIGR00697 family)